MFVLYLPSFIVAVWVAQQWQRAPRSWWPQHDKLLAQPQLGLLFTAVTLNPSVINQLLSHNREERAPGRSSTWTVKCHFGFQLISQKDHRVPPSPEGEGMQSHCILRMREMEKHLLTSTNKLLRPTSLVIWYRMHFVFQRQNLFTTRPMETISKSHPIVAPRSKPRILGWCVDISAYGSDVAPVGLKTNKQTNKNPSFLQLRISLPYPSYQHSPIVK